MGSESPDTPKYLPQVGEVWRWKSDILQMEDYYRIERIYMSEKTSPPELMASLTRLRDYESSEFPYALFNANDLWSKVQEANDDLDKPTRDVIEI